MRKCFSGNDSKKQIAGYRLIRQKRIGRYIVDFFCKELSLVIEVDTSSHYIRGDEVRKRRKDLENLSSIVIRVPERDFCYNIEGVVEEIRQKLLQIAQEQRT
ncbi:endonuclease domain-containing protein [Mesotoga sp.]|uniref:endonuclease domain-containing protein n=1 Tax=Mesotoga sp. TaxID=2053577 RepID=UPI0026201A01|nr:DUF559 domain-containing protein [Mesotoga sp.]MDD4207638.1 DUF559 domain-containing protein [Mesotoga sp.]MDD4826402.1 DUF559 domain-containing protein [Mesotoga sp.]